MRTALPVPPSQERVTGRQHYWDGIRAVLMWLGIPYHASLLYRTKPEWSVSLQIENQSIVWIGQFLSTFRMPCFFMVAGYFSALILARTERVHWLKTRVVRLLVPFVTAAIVINSLQIVLSHLDDLLRDKIDHHAFKELVKYDYTHIGEQWVRHLWFLMALTAYSVLITFFQPYIHKTVRELRDASRFLTNSFLLAATSILLLIIYMLAIKLASRTFGHIPIDLSINGFIPWYEAAANLPFFLAGYMILQLEPWKAFFFRKSIALDCFGLACSVLSAALSTFQPDKKFIALCSGSVAAILTSRLIIYLFKTHFTRENIWIKNFVDASFTIYLVHQPLISLVGIFFIISNAQTPLRYIAIVVIVTVLSYFIHKAVELSNLALFLFNGISQKKRI